MSICDTCEGDGFHYEHCSCQPDYTNTRTGLNPCVRCGQTLLPNTVHICPFPITAPCKNCQELQEKLKDSEYLRQNAVEKVVKLEAELHEAQDGCISRTGTPCHAMRERELWRKSHNNLKQSITDVVEKMKCDLKTHNKHFAYRAKYMPYVDIIKLLEQIGEK